MLCVVLTIVLTTLGWITAVALLLVAVGLISDRVFGRPQWTPDSYRADREERSR